MKKINDEVTLKKELDKFDVRYGSTMNKNRFFVEFIDNKAGSVICHGVYASPIVAIRQLNDILQKFKLPDTDIDIVLRFAFETIEDKTRFVDLNLFLFSYSKYTGQELNSNRQTLFYLL